MSAPTTGESATREAPVQDTPPGPSLLTRVTQRTTHWMTAIPPAWRYALLATLALRVIASILAFAFGGLLPGLDPVGVAPVAGSSFTGWVAHSPMQQGVGLLGAGLERFDSLWYLSIAEGGYPAGGPGFSAEGFSGQGTIPGAAAFFPGYPLVVGVLGRILFGHYFLAASLVSLAATVIALAGLYRLVEFETGDAILARRTVAVTAAFPTAFFLIAPYTESLFLASSVWALLWMRQRRWGHAAVAGAAAGLTRNVGVLLALPMLVEAVTVTRASWSLRRARRAERAVADPVGAAGAAVAINTTGEAGAVAAQDPHREDVPVDTARDRRERFDPRPLLAVGAPAAGLSIYLLFGWARFGTPLAPVAVQSGWERVFTLPWITLKDAVAVAVQHAGTYATGYHTLDLIVVLPALAAMVWLWFRAPRSFALFATANALVWLAYPFPSRPLMSVPRFLLAVAPLFWAMAAWLHTQRRETFWLAASGALFGVHLLLFVDWYYVF